MQLQYCFVLFLLSRTVLKSSQECTQGFIDYELLSIKAVHIGDSTIDDTVTGIGTKKDNRTYVVPELNFTCSGNITGFLLAIDIRIHGDRDLYPWVALFNRVDSTFTQVPGSQRYIVLGPDDFSTSGLFNYTLSSPIQFSSGNIIGVHQPNFTASVVRLQRQRYGTSTDHIIRINNNGGAITNINNIHFNYFNSTLLMLPIADCLSSGFISFEDLLMNARLVTTVNQYYGLFNDNNMFFKDIKFTCDGTIRNVIVGMKEYNLSSSILLPEIRIWRLVNNTHYTQSGPTIPLNYSHAEPDLSTAYLRWYNLSVPMKEGDVLGIYHTNIFDNRESVIYHQRYSGPYNYYSSGGDIDQVYDYNIYPLISVVFSKFVASTSSILFSTSSTNTEPVMSSSSISTSIKFSSVTTPIPTSTNTISVITSITPYTTVPTATSISMLGSTRFGEVVTSPSGSDSSISVQNGTMSSSLHQTKTSLYLPTSTIHPSQVDAEPNGPSIVPILAGIIVSVAIILAIIAAVTTIILVIAIKQRKKLYTITAQSDSRPSLSNMMYESNVAAVGDSNGGITNMMYNAVHPINGEALPNPMYQDVSHRKECDHASTFKSDVPSTSKHIELSSINSTTLVPGTQEKETTVNTLTNALYGEWDNKDSMHDDKKIYNTIRSGVCVPTESQRQELSGKGKQENIYAVLGSNYSSISDCGEGFFKEEPLYWDPENSTKGVYEQLAQQRYREIPRHEIRLVSHLGSGQFGTVDKGIWDTPKGPVEVAVKTLSGSITEEDEVKFLQEAAINGQFHHPNVVQLCGVVTVGQPTMIVLEYITHGDLKSFLEARRPNPGELPDASLAPLLFKFSHQVACGMAYLSRKKFIHRDLAARNILVDNGTVCKIADFGMSRNLQDETYYTSKNKKIPVKWTAPEAIYYRKYSTQSDVWSFGALLYEVWSVGYKPFEQYTNQECISLIESGYRLPSPSGCPQVVYEIMINCWNPVSSDRPSFGTLQSSLSSNSQSLSSPSDHPLSNLGSSVLLHDQSLYPELQNKYK